MIGDAQGVPYPTFDEFLDAGWRRNRETPITARTSFISASWMWQVSVKTLLCSRPEMLLFEDTQNPPVMLAGGFWESEYIAM